MGLRWVLGTHLVSVLLRSLVTLRGMAVEGAGDGDELGWGSGGFWVLTWALDLSRLAVTW